MDTGVQKYRAFVMATDLGSFAAAAARLDYSVSSVSRMVADLESDCGLRLLERGKEGVRLTPDGEALIDEARRVIAACDEFGEAANDIAHLDVGTVRVGTISSVATHVLPKAIRAFRQAHPSIQYELLLGDYAQIQDWLNNGRIDIGTIRSDDAKNLATQPLVTDDLVAIVPADHELARRTSVNLSKLAEEPFIALEQGRESEVSQLMRKAGIVVKPFLSTWDDYAIMAMVEAHLGVAILPSLILRRCAYDIVGLSLNPAAHREIALAWRPDRKLSAAATAFLECIAAQKGDAVL